MLTNNQKKDIIQTPIRMCVICRGKDTQKNLHRLQIKETKIVKFSGVGRSFYVCALCIKKDEKVLQKAFSKLYNGIIQPNFKEIFLNDKG